MFRDISQGVRFTLITMVLFGGVYPLAMWGLARAVFPVQAEGSLVRRSDGSVIGSRLIAQAFTRPEYFRPRPSGVDYNAAATGGTNNGPSSPDQLKAARERLAAIVSEEKVPADRVPSEMLTASGGGLDPHIPPAAADLQAARVATARNIPVEWVLEVVRAHTEPPTFGFLGRARINVLELNLALDEALGAPKGRGSQ